MADDRENVSNGTRAAVVVIGNEILSGRTRDANLGYIATKLAEIGIGVGEARIVPDDADCIVAAVDALRARFDFVFTTGGIGPTHDDITAAAVARAFGRRLVRHEEAERRLRGYYAPEAINAARLSMADMPEGSTLIDNPVSASPGFRVENVFVLPGVPRILQAMIDLLVPQLPGGPPVAVRALTVFAAEGEIAERLRELQARHAAVELGSYPFMRQGRFGTTVICRGPCAARVAAAHAELRATFEAAALPYIEVDAADGSAAV